MSKIGLIIFLIAFAVQPFFAVATTIAYLAAGFTALAMLVEK